MYRGRHRRRTALSLLAPPVVLVAAAGATISAAAAQPNHPPHPAAAATTGAALPSVVSPLGPLPPPAKLHFTTARPRPPQASALLDLPAHIDLAAASIPRRVLAAYVHAAQVVDKRDASCDLQWQTLAGIGFIESDHARSGGSAARRWDGVAEPPIYGPPLDGASASAKIANTDPAVDGPGPWARAVGPMQFIPSTWAQYAVDANGDGVANPQDIDDATLAAADYLCTVTDHLDRKPNRIAAIHAYNHSYTYVRDVLTAAAHYADIDPKRLGIDGLPKDGKHHKRHRHDKAGRKHHQPAATMSPSTTPTARPHPNPSSTKSASTPTPAPTPTPTVSTSPGDSPTDSPTETPTPADPPTQV